MATTTRVKLSYGRTINIGNYESFRIDVGVEVDLGPKDKPDKVFEDVAKALLARLEKEEKRALND